MQVDTEPLTWFTCQTVTGTYGDRWQLCDMGSLKAAPTLLFASGDSSVLQLIMCPRKRIRRLNVVSTNLTTTAWINDLKNDLKNSCKETMA